MVVVWFVGFFELVKGFGFLFLVKGVVDDYVVGFLGFCFVDFCIYENGESFVEDLEG